MSGKRFIYLICCSAACLGLVLSACDDDPENPGDTSGDTTTSDMTTTTPDTSTTTADTTEDTTDTSTTTDATMGDSSTDTAETDTDTCMTTVDDCTANGQMFDAENCVCFDVGSCQGQPLDGTAECDTSVGQPSTATCIDLEGDGTAECYAFCDATTECATSSICDEMAEACIPSDCEGFFNNTCDGGNKCIPVGNGANFCTTNGMGADGDECQAHTDCGAGLLCGGICFAPECAPLTGTPSCDGGEQCNGFSIGDDPIDIGECVELCNPFARDGAGVTQDSCGTPGDGEFCQPLDSADASGNINGVCSTDGGGTVAAGGTCDNSTPGTTCSSPDGGGADPLLCVGSTCEIMCDPGDQTTCPGMDQGCFQVTFSTNDGGTFTPDWGLCSTTCDPSWDPDDPGACEAGQYCWPDFDVAGIGRCFTENEGTGRDGDSCDVTTRDGCDDLHLCFTSEQDAGGNPIAAECSQLCDPTANAGEAGSCAAGPNGQGRTCLALNADDGMGGSVPLPVGTCNDTCDVADLANNGCTNASDGSRRYCQVGELFGISGIDLCTGGPATPLAINEECAGKVEPGGFCKDNGFCIDLGTGSRCTEACYPAGDPSPDCSQATATCENPGFPEPLLGICQL